VNTILHTAVAGKEAGLQVGPLALLMLCDFGWRAFTGASLNPARTLGPAIFVPQAIQMCIHYVIYLFGPLIGATFAVLVYNFLNDIDEDLDELEEVEEIVVAVEAEPVVEETPVKKTRKPAVRKTANK
jgi:hypothetical protein